jgi:glucokinase
MMALTNNWPQPVMDGVVWLLQSPKAVLGPGTGLGEAILIYEEGFDGYR